MAGIKECRTNVTPLDLTVGTSSISKFAFKSRALVLRTRAVAIQRLADPRSSLMRGFSFLGFVGGACGVTLKFGQDVDWPPYAYKNATTGQLMGFGKDIADGMSPDCS